MCAWDESKPEVGDQIRDFGLVVRSHKTDFRAGIEKHFNWTESSGASAGESRLAISLTTPGSCRAFYDVESNVSAFRDGSLYLTSDTTRLYGLTSTSSVLLGSARAVRAATTGAQALGWRVLVQDGTEASVADERISVVFPIVYGVAPSVMITADYPAAQTDARVAIHSIASSGFSANVEITGGNIALLWRSMGTVAL